MFFQQILYHLFVQVLRWDLMRALHRKRPRLVGHWKLHHDNASSHTAFKVKTTLEGMGVHLVKQAAYSPDTTPCDFFLFPAWRREVQHT